jgi:uracil-DNA glycosylase family 4
MDKKQYLKSLGLIDYQFRLKKNQNNQANNPAKIENIYTLNSAISICKKCQLCNNRIQAIAGFGSLTPTWLIVGEAPREQEDRQNTPFADEEWKLLEKMLASINISPNNAYITNVMKCKVDKYKKPTLEQLSHCEPYLFQQILYLKPKIILTLGKVAAQALSGEISALRDMRGKVFYFNNIKCIATYHPAYLLQNPQEKRKAWHDLLMAQHEYELLQEV